MVLGRLANICRLAAGVFANVQYARRVIFDGRIIGMFKHIFDATEAIFRAAILLLILLIGLEALVLGVFVSGLLFYRIGEFLWVFILRESWL
jgi:hypothetical protein